MPVSALEAAQQLRELNKKIVTPIPEGLLDARPPIHIFNVGTKRWTVPLGGLGTFTILEREEGEAYSKPCIVKGYVPEGVATDMKKIEIRYEPGEKIAKEIIGIGPFKDPSQDLRKHGVFIAAGPIPTAQELELAHDALRGHYINLVQEGDKFHAQGPLHVENITADHRHAVAFLNLDREWAKLPTALVPCDGCGENVKPGIVTHGGKYGCGWIFDKERALAGGLIEATPEPDPTPTKGKNKNAAA